MASHRMLIVGVGSIGERHTRTFKATGRAELSICESNETLRTAVAGRYGITETFPDLDEALNKGRFDTVLIATPSHLHIPMATKCALAGKNLFIEKPLSLCVDGIEALRQVIADRKLKAAVAYTYRSHPALRSMKEAIDSGRFGRPVQIVGTWGQHFPKYRPAYREIYYTSRTTGGGAIQDVLTHAVNAGEFLVGPIDRIMADAAHQVLEGVTVEDTVHLIARHGRVMGCYSLNQHQAPNENTLTVICERGTARWDLNNARWQSMVEPDAGWKTEFEFSRERDDIFVNQARLFLDALENKGPFACTLDEGLQTLRVNLTVLGAADHPSWVSLAR
ncbi:MAG TPA: Gfo/Idh/MocA family oxidoreductase [Phycisphaerae bacterium]|nr:Gfo/Idh/MocA family oxidoreductase [Phycisphaerae bacterium]HRY68620.1 Gfo/Idh/MocA family oxidoreductase [Phycisphaerae bacterium]HSA25669.1 Gfo/Idh/MocA family oxidoreductase [Phycisphaerae bacterium]